MNATNFTDHLDMGHNEEKTSASCMVETSCHLFAKSRSLNG